MSKLSYKNIKYSIQEYDPSWKKKFRKEVKIIKTIFAGKALRIEHIGSTSVPGLAGKPIIDILVLVNSVREIDKLNTKMENAGYQVLNEYVMPGTRLFVKEKGGVRTINLHVFQKNHPHVKEMLQLRDYLRVHPKDAKEYSDLKFKLAEKYPADYAQYRKHKDRYMKGLKDKVGRGK